MGLEDVKFYPFNQFMCLLCYELVFAKFPVSVYMDLLR